MLISVRVNCGVLFEVRAEFLNIICKTVGFKWLIIHIWELSPLILGRSYTTLTGIFTVFFMLSRNSQHGSLKIFFQFFLYTVPP
jgi:hypothetical protein